MAVFLPVCPFNLDPSDFGEGPGRDVGAPRWNGSVYPIQPDDLEADLADAAANNYTLFLNLTGNRTNWTDPVGGSLIFNRTKWENWVLRFLETGEATKAGAAALVAALNSRRAVIYVIDEPHHEAFGGSIPREVQNQLGLFVKSIWPGAITVIRQGSRFFTPPPAGGWTGVDYGISMWNGRGNQGGIVNVTAREFFDFEREAFDAMDVGMIPGLNWLDGGLFRDLNPNLPDPCWDAQNNGTSSGYRTGTHSLGSHGPNVFVSCGNLDPAATRVVCSPDLITHVMDGVFDDPKAPAFLIWTLTSNSFNNAHQSLETRSDIVTAFDALLNKAATRPTSDGWRPAKGVQPPPPPPPPGGGSGANFSYTEVTEPETTTSTSYVDVPGAVIQASELVAGEQYLIYVTGQFHFSNSGNAYVRTMHGATQFLGSEYSWIPTGGATLKHHYGYWTVYTAVAGEDIKLQFHKESGASGTVGGDQITLFALNLTDLGANAFFYDDHTTSTALNGTPADGASITFTPNPAGDPWLILTQASYITPSGTQSVISRLNRSGEAAENDPECRQEGEDIVLDQPNLVNAKVLTLGNVSNTFKEQSYNSGGGGPRVYSQVFALNLDKFPERDFAYTAATLDYADTDVSPFGTTAQTLAFEPLITSPVWLFASHIYVPDITAPALASRLQVDNADAPPTQTADQYRLNTPRDATDQMPIQHQSVMTLSDALHNIDLDASLETSGAGNGGKARLIVAIQLGTVLSPPTWNAISDVTVEAETPINFIVSASDAVVAEEDLVYSVVSVLPVGALFDPTQRRFAWTPSVLQANPENPYSITLRVSNGETTADETFLITVNESATEPPPPTDTPFDAIRNLRFDGSIKAGRLVVSVSWSTGGAFLAGLLKHGITGVIVEMVDMERDT